MPPQSRIRVKGDSKLKIDGAEIKSANNSSWNGIEIQDNSSLEILPGTEINNSYFYAYTGIYSSAKSVKRENSYILDEQSISISDKSKIFVYPNPVKGFINIKFNEKINNFLGTELTLIDINGKVLYKNTIKKNTTQLNLSEYKKGLYILRFKSGANTFYTKILK